MLDGRIWWPLFPLLLLVVVVSLTWALVAAVRGGQRGKALWLQIGAFGCYLMAAVSAVASERGAVPVNLHRPFSLATQLCLLLLILHHRKGASSRLMWLNAIAWAGILADTALHYLVVRR